MRALELLGDWPVRPGAAGVLVRQSGACDATINPVETAETFGDLDAVSDWASVTKLVVSLATLIEAEKGTLGLDDPCGPPGSTVRHLLSHASGLAPDRREPLMPPGRRRIYSNAGFEVLGEYLSIRSASTWQSVVARAVTEPLGMTTTYLEEDGSPASSARGSVSDLLALGSELLSPTTISSSVLRMATQVVFPGLSGVVPGFGRFDNCDWGLGFEIKDSKQPHWTATNGSPSTFGHFGRSGAFLWVDPDAGVACATAGGSPFGEWSIEKWPELSDAVLRTWAGSGRPGTEVRGS